MAGALYFNTTDDIMKVYDGSVWVAAYASLSGALLQANNLSDVLDVAASRTNLGLGTAATTASTAYATAAQGALADSAVQPNDSPSFGSVTVTGTVDGRDVAADGSKLDGIEAGATADQTAGEIKTAYESNANTNAYTDAEKSKLAGIASGAEVNTVDSVNAQTGAVVLDADDISDAATTNKFTTAAEISKLAGIEAGANVTDTANVTAAGALMDSEVTNLAQVKAFSSADYATAAQGSLADSALQSGDNVSALTNDAGYTTNVGDITGVTAGGGITGGGTSGTVTINHADTSSQASVNNSGATVIQDVTVDTYGHVTALGSKTLTAADVGAITGNQTITLSGDVSGSGTTSISVTVADDSHNHIISNVDGLQAALDGKLSTSGKAADSNLLDGLDSTAFYLASNPSGYTSNVGDITGVTAGTGLSGGGTSGTVTLSHADTSALSGVYGSTADGTKIDTITVDANGHVTAVTTGATGDIQGVTAGSGISGGGTSGTVTISHADTSAQGSVNNSGTTFIQDITLDTYGHITSIGSATVSSTGIGDGQSWQYPSRSMGTTYQNTTGKPIAVALRVGSNSTAMLFEVSSNNSTWFTLSSSQFIASGRTTFGIVPHNHYYRITQTSGTLYTWAELR